ncbi:MAG: pyruvate ferredoxin oxidoreductase, partial [Candidatus Omnitrophica bacterium]|nr:pyruvate ferredoxin oxidoreductase [Candidatus Omnitrophota bacterium]
SAFFGKKKAPKVISSFIVGMGGRDITKDSIKEVYRLLGTKELAGEFIDLKPELLKESYE